MIIEIKAIFTNAGGKARTNIEAVVEAVLTQWTSTQQSGIVNPVHSLFENATERRYFY